MKKKNIKKILTILCALYASAAFAQNDGPKVVVPSMKKPLVTTKKADAAITATEFDLKKVSGIINLQTTQPRAELTHSVKNLTKKQLKVDLNPQGVTSKKITFRPNQTIKVDWNVPLKIQQVGRLVQSVRISPQLLLNETLPLKPVENFSIEIILPAEAKKLLKSNKPLVFRGKKDGRLVYKWSGRDTYLTTAMVFWTTSDVNLSMTKEINLNWGQQTVSVTLNVKNEGQATAQNIILKEDFPSQTFEGISRGSQGNFSVYQGQFNDQRLIWQYSLPHLTPGEQTEVRYQLKLKYAVPEIRLYETRALEQGEPIAVTEMLTVKR